MPFNWQFVIPLLNCPLANHCTKFEVSSFYFSCSRDIIGGSKNLNRSRDHNHAPFGGDFLFFW